jgi:hypothetical protein
MLISFAASLVLVIQEAPNQTPHSALGPPNVVISTTSAQCKSNTIELTYSTQNRLSIITRGQWNKKRFSPLTLTRLNEAIKNTQINKVHWFKCPGDQSRATPVCLGLNMMTNTVPEGEVGRTLLLYQNGDIKYAECPAYPGDNHFPQ